MSRIITASELAGRSLTELHVLHRQILDALQQLSQGSDAYRQALASLEAVRCAIRLRQQIGAPRF